MNDVMKSVIQDALFEQGEVMMAESVLIAWGDDIGAPSFFCTSEYVHDLLQSYRRTLTEVIITIGDHDAKSKSIRALSRVYYACICEEGYRDWFSPVYQTACFHFKMEQLDLFRCMRAFRTIDALISQE